MPNASLDAARSRGRSLQSLKDGKWINTYERRSRSNHFAGVRLEVTDLVSKTRELHARRDRLQAIISSAAACIVNADAQGAVVEASAVTFAAFGAAPHEVVGRPLSAVLPSVDLAAFATPTDGGTPDPAGRRAEVAAVARDGKALQLLVSVSQIGAGDARQFAVIIGDVTELAEAERARQTLEAQRIESIGTLASGIAEARDTLARWHHAPGAESGRKTVPADCLAPDERGPSSARARPARLSPLEFMQRLAAVVPRPRLQLIRFRGVLAPNAKLRAPVVPRQPEPPAQATQPAECEESAFERPVLKQCR